MDFEIDGEAPQHGIYLPTLKLHVPPICHVVHCWWVHIWGLLVSELCCLSWSDGLSCKMWSQMCGSWYLPKFLLCEGSLTHMYIASFIFLRPPVIFC